MDFSMTTYIDDKVLVGPVDPSESEFGDTVYLQIVTDGDHQVTAWLRPAERAMLSRALKLVS